MVGKAQKLHGVRSGLYGGCSNEVLLVHFFSSRTQNSIQISPHAISGLLQPWKWSSEAKKFRSNQRSAARFEKWVEHCQKCIAFQERYFEKETVTAPASIAYPKFYEVKFSVSVLNDFSIGITQRYSPGLLAG
jgi:hypothetical protein